MRARACIKCKEYLIIHANNPLNQNKIEFFERKHHLHTLITVDLDEIKDQYQIIKNNGSHGSHEENHNS
ncbi:MAG: hypothetical protein KGD61_01975 [Candidatus Lokiarchaeota archaeon]|nr:hypothetical protein [Candidatus Lokiarchaeota archaeon]